jgi:DNA primase
MNLSKEEIHSILSSYIRFSDQEIPGENLAAHCPFHKGGKEQRPSFYVYIGKSSFTRHTGMSFCHTCNRGWSLTGLLKALRVGPALIDIIKQELGSAESEAKRDPLLSIDFALETLPEASLGLFEYMPKALVDVGFSKELLASYDVGFDRMRKRITFALRNHHGELVGISGRSVRGEHPRYKIYRAEFHELSPSYALNKKKLLYGLDKFYARRMYTDIDMPVVLCEGFKACLWCVQAGYVDTVALLGSTLSREQLVLLQRVTNSVVLFLDNDAPGREATTKIAKQLSGIEVRVADYRTDAPISPDDLTSEQLKLAIEGALKPWPKKKGKPDAY